MRIVVNTPDHIHFDLELNGDVHKLKITPLTVKDAVLEGELVNQYLSNEDMPDSMKNILGVVSRVMCSVKTEDNDYFFKGKVEEVVETMPYDFWYAILPEVAKLSQTSVEGDLEARKK